MGIDTPVGCGQQADRCCRCSWFSVLSTEERKSLYLHQFAQPAQERLSSHCMPRRPVRAGTVRHTLRPRLREIRAHNRHGHPNRFPWFFMSAPEGPLPLRWLPLAGQLDSGA